MSVTKPRPVNVVAGCPYCGAQITVTEDIYRSGDARPPEDGDVGVCFRCTRLSMWRTTPMGYLLQEMDERWQQEQEEVITTYLNKLRDFNRRFPPENRTR